MTDDSLYRELRIRKVDSQHSDELNTVGEPDTKTDKSDTKAKVIQRESAYSVQNILLLISSVAVFFYTDIVHVFLYDTHVNRLWFNIGLILLVINLCIAFVLIVYLSWIKKLTSDEWEQHYPAAIPIATACFAFGSFCLTIGLWPLWGVFTIPILFTQFMGVVVLIAMSPDF